MIRLPRLPLPSRKMLLPGLWGLFCYLFFLLASFPAPRAWQLVPAEYKAGLQTGLISGSLWSGRMQELQIGKLSAGRLDWDLKLLALFTGKLAADLDINGQLGQWQARLAVGPDGRIEASGIRGRLPASTLNPYTIPATLDGEIEIELDSVIFQAQQQLALQGQARWRKAVISMMQSVELGEVSVSGKPDGDASLLQLGNRNSALGFEGTLRLDANGRYRLKLGLFNRDANRKDIRSLLQMLGRPDATGKVWLNRQGQIPLRF